MKWTNLILVLALVMFATGCATIISGKHQDVSFSSSPSGAAVYIDGMNRAITPATIGLERKKKRQQVRIELPGYEPYEMVITRGFNGWYVGNLVFGGLIGLIVDPITGAMYKLNTDMVSTSLRQSGGTASVLDAPNGDQIYIELRALPADHGLEKVGQFQALGYR